MNEYQSNIEKNGVLSFTPGGISMWPIISNRTDTVIIKAATHTLKKYDVAFYERESGQVVLHRVLKVHETTYDMCGDSQTAVETEIPHSAVFGVMVGYYKQGKYIDCYKNVLYKCIVRLWSGSIFFRRCVLKGLSLIGIRAH